MRKHHFEPHKGAGVCSDRGTTKTMEGIHVAHLAPMEVYHACLLPFKFGRTIHNAFHRKPKNGIKIHHIRKCIQCGTQQCKYRIRYKNYTYCLSDRRTTYVCLIKLISHIRTYVKVRAYRTALHTRAISIQLHTVYTHN